jgi:hypothetical protein
MPSRGAAAKEMIEYPVDVEVPSASKRELRPGSWLNCTEWRVALGRLPALQLGP